MQKQILDMKIRVIQTKFNRLLNFAIPEFGALKCFKRVQRLFKKQKNIFSIC